MRVFRIAPGFIPPPPTQVRTHLKLDAYALSEETMRSVWVALDSDGSGYLSVAELRLALTTKGEPLTDEEVDEMFREADVDPAARPFGTAHPFEFDGARDGRLSLSEFVKMMAFDPVAHAHTSFFDGAAWLDNV